MQSSIFACLLLLCSCSSMQKGLTIGTGAVAGGFAAEKLSNGDPLLTGAGTLAGAGLGFGINAMADANGEKTSNVAYGKAQNDAIKQHYWMLQNYQEHYQEGGTTNTYKVVIPGSKDAYGVQTVAREATVRIVE